ncbi:MAG: DegT/DnrJ/EryC1/StrS aminotransferase family protein [Treponema sp.]|nr:DegT/DnrJ/EryC1/StrS aminotransferase family protein [Treponema sp.]
MIRTYSTTIRRKEMDAVLTCMVDEKIGPGELNSRFIQQVKDFFHCDGAVALRSPALALRYALRALDANTDTPIMISALAPNYQIRTIEDMGLKPIVLDVDESNALVSASIVQQGIKDGGRILVLHEAMGIMPDISSITALNIPIIEDVSASAGATLPAIQEQSQEGRNASSFGTFAILGLEEHDVITAGGGAVLMANKRRDWIALKKFTDSADPTDLLPDLNCALATVELKEFNKNERTRKEIFSLYHRACMASRHKILSREMEHSSTMSAFPLLLSSSYKDARLYAEKKDIEIVRAFEGSVILSREEELSQLCKNAKSISLRCVLFPLYPRLTKTETEKIIKVLGTLP